MHSVIFPMVYHFRGKAILSEEIPSIPAAFLPILVY